MKENMVSFKSFVKIKAPTTHMAVSPSQTISTALGNTLEWFDFGLFIFMAPIIGSQFFPHQTAHLATLETLGVFAAGFVCRPLGGILFGHIGDTRGRATSLRMSLLLISLSTLFIGLLPSYSVIGPLAPALFILTRLIQGISIGGEYSGVMVYLSESAPPNKRGLFTSFAAMGANLGFLLATLSLVWLQLCFSTTHLHAFAWRIPFILIGMAGFIILYFRFQLTETAIYQQLQSAHEIVEQPLTTALTHAPKQLLKITGMTCMGASFYYFFFGYMPIYLNQYSPLTAHTTLIIVSGLLVSLLVLTPLAGILGDQWSRKKMLCLAYSSAAILILPCFLLLHQNTVPLIFLALLIATFISALEQGNSLAAAVENCPINIRYSGIALSYNLGNALFGGTAPLMIAYLTTEIGGLAPALYLLLMACISALTALTIQPNNGEQAALLLPPKQADSLPTPEAQLSGH